MIKDKNKKINKKLLKKINIAKKKSKELDEEYRQQVDLDYT